MTVLGLTAAAWGQGDGAVFDQGLLETWRLIEDRRWKEALDRLRSLLDAHAGQDCVLSRRIEILEIHRRCSFHVARAVPEPEDAISGALLAHSDSSGRIKVRYTPATLEGDFKKDHGLLVFTGYFVGPYTLTVTGTEFPKPAAEFIVGYRRDGRDATDLRLEAGPTGGELLMWRLHVARKNVVEAAIPQKLCRPRYKLLIRVDTRQVAVHYNGRRVATLDKPKDLFGKVALKPFNFDALLIEGKAHPSWIRSRVDARVAEQRKEFEKKYDPKRTLPARLFPKADADGSREDDILDRLPGSPSDETRRRLRNALRFIRKGDYERAAKGLKQKKPTVEVKGAFLYLLALARFGLQDYEGAMQACDEACAGRPDFVLGQALRARILANSGRQDRAVEVLSGWVAKGTDVAEAYEVLAMIRLFKGRPDEARRVLVCGLRHAKRRTDLERIYGLLLKAKHGPRWSEVKDYKTPNYHIFSDLDHRTCAEAGRVLENAYRAFNVRLKWTKGKTEERFRVYLFFDRSGYLAYTKHVMGISPTMSAGLFSPILKQLLIWNLPNRTDMMRTVRHEGFHQYLDRIMPDPPTWLNEGLAEYYERSEYRGGEWQVGHVRRDHLVQLDPPLPLREFLAQGRREFYKKPFTNYAQAWALVHFLQHGPPRYQKLFDCLFEALQAQESGRAVVERVFKDVDLDAMEHAFKAHLSRL